MYVLSLFAAYLSAHEIGRPKFEIRRMQQLSMERALTAIQSNENKGIYRMLRRGSSDVKDCCNWRFVECTAGRVTTFVLPMVNPEFVREIEQKVEGYYDAFDLDLEWLPHSIAYLLIDRANHRAPFSLSQLPRDLRYCNLNGLDPLHISADSLTAQLNFADLPRNLEECVIVSRSTLFGSVVIPKCPQKLRICIIWSAKLSSVRINGAALPKCLEKMDFMASKAFKIESIGKVSDAVKSSAVHQGRSLSLAKDAQKVLRLGKNAEKMLAGFEEEDSSWV